MVLRSVPFAGSRWLFGIVAPVSLLLAVWLPWTAWSEGARGERLMVGLAWALIGVCLSLCLYNPKSFRWAGAAVAGLLLLLVGGYDVQLFQAWQQGLFVMSSHDALLMVFVHVVIGWPSAIHIINTLRRAHPYG